MNLYKIIEIINSGKFRREVLKFTPFNPNKPLCTKLINIKRQNSGSLVNSITKMSKNELITQSDFSDDSISLLSTEIFLNDDID